MDISPFTCLLRDGLVGWALRSGGLTFTIVLSRRFSHSLLPSLGEGDVGGDPGDGVGGGFDRMGCLVCWAGHVITLLQVHD